MTQFEFEPSPPVQGKELIIYWSGQTPATIKFDWTPPGLPESVYLVKGQTGAVVQVPEDAESVIVTCEGDEHGEIVSPA